MKPKITYISLICCLFICNSQLFGGWELLQNSPTTNDLHSVFFLDDNVGWIAGDNSTLYKTTNSGVSWVQQTSPEASNFQCITFVDANTGWACGSGGVVIKTTNGGTNWFSQTFTGVKFNSLDFIDVNTGYICGDNGIIWKTTNGGSNWINQPSGIIQNLHQIKIVDANTVFAVGDYAYILKTSNGGISWEIKNGPSIGGQIFYSLANASIYGAIASGTLTKYSTDEGESWSLGQFPAEPIYSIISISNLDHSYYGVGVNGYIVKTDWGTNWTQAQSPTTQNLYSVHYANSSNFFWAVGANGTILKNTPNWVQQTSPHTSWLNSVSFINANEGYTVGVDGIILKTTNGGAIWDSLSSGTTEWLSSVYFINANEGYTVGGGGTILKTTNGGAIWDSLSSGTTGWLNSVYFLDANLGYTCDAYEIYKTTDGGNNWYFDELTPLFTYGLAEIDFVVENNTAVGFAVGGQILRTSFEYLGGEPIGNSGSYPGWVQVNSGTTGGISGADYINPFVAFAVGGESVYDGMILRTINGGQTWTRQQSNVNYNLGDISFADVNNGIAVGGFGTIVRTTNSGAEWIQQTSGTTQWILAVDMLDINNAFACGGGNTIFHTSDAGTSWQLQNSGTSSGYWWDIDYINPTTATAVGLQGKIIRTTNAGANWFAQTGGMNLTLLGVKFIDVNSGIAISSQGPVLRTTDGGTNWIQTDSLGGVVSDISYIDSNNVFVVTQNTGDGSRIYHSTNGGLNWILQDIREDHLMAVSFADSNNGLITGLDGLILRTSNSGVSSGANTAHHRNGLNLPIGDFQNTDDSINVIITDNPSAYAVTRVYVTIDTVLHTNDGDLEFYLEHNGITDTLIYQNGEGGENFLGTFLNDETNFPLVSGTAPFRGSFEPYRPLSKFNGQNPDGYWNLRIYDRASGNTGTLDAWSLTLLYQTATDVTDDIKIPSQYLLSQNFPNPFNPRTTIRYGLTQKLLVTIKIYNILGQEVTTLVNEEKPAGSYEVNFYASRFSSGVYFYRIQAGSFIETKKMILLR